MREIALKNAGDEARAEVKAEYPPPPPLEEEDLGDVSIDLSAAMEAEVAQALDESGIERVPMADPGIGGVPMADEPGSPGAGQGAHVRRRSVLPGAFARESVSTKL
jgi:serine/threonine-protein phosphatase 2A regulatory subunit B'